MHFGQAKDNKELKFPIEKDLDMFPYTHDAYVIDELMQQNKTPFEIINQFAQNETLEDRQRVRENIERRRNMKKE